jgi:hypothetical protein
MRGVVVVALVLLVSGCGPSPAAKTKTVIATEQVPPAVMKAAQTREPQVKFNKVLKTSEGIYEVQGKNPAGKIIEVEVSEAGEVLKVE